MALYKLRTEADNHRRTLYGNNQAVYSLLRYGVPVKIEAGQVTETVQLIDWREPEKNDFAIAEEVTLKGNLERRPDLVLYVNGIAIGVIELKNSRVSIGDGIRQMPLQPAAGVQRVVLQPPSSSSSPATTPRDCSTAPSARRRSTSSSGRKTRRTTRASSWTSTCSRCATKERLIELMHDFVLFDGGVKKLPRVHQYFGIKAAQEHVRQKKGGIIWHTQGSGKSIVMVLLAKWILENNPNARVAIITDRDELDKQIERVFTDAGETIYRSKQRPRPDEPARPGHAAPALLAGAQVRPQGRGRLRRLHQGAGGTSRARRSARCSSSWTSAIARRAASCTR